MTASQITIRPAAEADLPAINDIYNHYVLTCTCTYQTEPETMESRRQWFADHDSSHPVIVAEMGEQVVGWGSLSPFHRRHAYRFTVENSVYIRHDMQRRGIGRTILSELVRLARLHGFHSIIAGISADRQPSIELHKAFGFAEVACLREVGYKFDQWLDVVYMQLMLKDGHA